MADRKQFHGTAKNDPELNELLDKAKEKFVSEEQLHEQRISFAFGNLPSDSKGSTKETVKKTSQAIRLIPAE